MELISEQYLKDVSHCDKIIDLFEHADEYGGTYRGVHGVGSKMNSVYHVKESQDCAPGDIFADNFYYPPPQDIVDTYYSVINEVDDMLYYWMRETLGREITDNRLLKWENLPQIQKYPEAGGFKSWHSDGASCMKMLRRQFVFILYLNTVPDGGTEFFYQKKYVEAVKGKVLMFPAQWMFKHRGEVSFTSNKYILTGWWKL